MIYDIGVHEQAAQATFVGLSVECCGKSAWGFGRRNNDLIQLIPGCRNAAIHRGHLATVQYLRQVL